MHTPFLRSTACLSIAAWLLLLCSCSANGRRSKEAAHFEQLVSFVAANHWQERNPASLYKRAETQLLNSLDGGCMPAGDSPYSAGIGITFAPGQINGAFPISSVDRDSGAARAGLLPGDGIVKVGVMTVTPKTTGQEVAAALMGTPSSTVQLQVRRNSQHQVVTVDAVRLHSTTAPCDCLYLYKGIAVARVTFLSTEAAKMVRAFVLQHTSDAVALCLDVRTCSYGDPDGLAAFAGLLGTAPDAIGTLNYRSGASRAIVPNSAFKIALHTVFILVCRRTSNEAKCLALALAGKKGIRIVGEDARGSGYVREIVDSPMGPLWFPTGAYIRPNFKYVGICDLHPDESIELRADALAAALDAQQLFAAISPDEAASKYGREIHVDPYVARCVDLCQRADGDR